MGEFTIIFRVRDYEKSVDFYSNGLKLFVINSWDRSPDERGTVYKAASGQIEILTAKQDVDYKQPQNFEISVQVENVDEYYSAMQSRGVKIHGIISNKPWGQRAFSVLDPDGVKLIFNTPIH